MDERLKEISERAEKAASAESDDFGHSVTECIEWQVSQLYQIDKDVQKLIEVIRVQRAALESIAEDYYLKSGDLSSFPRKLIEETVALDTDIAKKALAGVEEILGEE